MDVAGQNASPLVLPKAVQAGPATTCPTPPPPTAPVLQQPQQPVLQQPQQPPPPAHMEPPAAGSAPAMATGPASGSPPAPGHLENPFEADEEGEVLEQALAKVGAAAPATPIGGCATPLLFDHAAIDLIGGEETGFSCCKCKLELEESERVKDYQQKKCSKDTCEKCFSNNRTLQKRFKKNKQLNIWWASKPEDDKTQWYLDHRECAVED